MNNIVMLPVSALKPYVNNPRNNKDAVDKVAASIEEFGFKQPIVVDKDYVIVVGHTRLQAPKKKNKLLSVCQTRKQHFYKSITIHSTQKSV